MEVAWGPGAGFSGGVVGVDVGDGGGGGEEWTMPRYSMMKEPGLRSLVAKRPAWPHAGWAGSVI